MARSFSNAKLLSSFLIDRVSVTVTRRGYVGSSQGGCAMAKKGGEEATKKTSSWVPDPVTGYYRPESHTNKMNVAELREMLLKNNTVRSN